MLRGATKPLFDPDSQLALQTVQRYFFLKACDN